LNHPEEGFRNVIIIRSAVPARKQGFLPGSENEKNEVFELPYQVIVEKFFDNDMAYKWLKNQDYLKFVSTSYLRGMTFEDAIIIVDECQNMNVGEINTVMTRIGKNCRVIVVGDSYQNDLEYLNEDTCFYMLPSRFERMISFDSIQMNTKDICRNDVVAEWILSG